MNLVDMAYHNRMELAAEIRRRRVQARVTWREMALYCGVSIHATQKWGGGANTPTRGNLERMEKLFAERGVK